MATGPDFDREASDLAHATNEALATWLEGAMTESGSILSDRAGYRRKALHEIARRLRTDAIIIEDLTTERDYDATFDPSIDPNIRLRPRGDLDPETADEVKKWLG